MRCGCEREVVGVQTRWGGTVRFRKRRRRDMGETGRERTVQSGDDGAGKRTSDGCCSAFMQSFDTMEVKLVHIVSGDAGC